MTEVNRFSWEKITQVFSVVMLLDRDLRILKGSDVLLGHMPEVAGDRVMPDLFHAVRPRDISSFDAVVRNSKTLFLLVSHDQRFAIRGQMIVDDGSGLLFFLGSPWLSWLTGNRPELKLGMRDFTPQDAQLDQLFYMTTERLMVQDLEQLNTGLQQASAEAQQAQQAKNAFFAQMSHEMRTPLNGVSSALSLMEDEPLPGKARELLRLARESASNLLEVVNYVMDVSKLETQGSEPESVVFDLPELVASVIDIVRAKAVERGLELDARVDSRLGTYYRGDPSRLRQSLLNLVINAVKFTRKGTVFIHVQPHDNDPARLLIEVIDSGIGINRADQQRIFEPFVSLDKGTRGAPEACSGLGLDIVRRNMESMNGSLGVSSAPGVGSTFWLQVPLLPVQQAPKQVMAAESGPRVTADFTGRILLVDDNETNLMLGGMILEGLGLEVTGAASGEEAVARLDTELPDLVLMDISMPGIDGFEATRIIRRSHPPEALPVVALTAYASSIERTKSEEAGMNAYLTKPIVKEELVRTLAKFLGPGARDRAAPRGGEAGTADTSWQPDTAIIDRLGREVGHDNLRLVIGRFCEESPRRWQALTAATLPADLAREAHTLNSTCRSFGLPGLADRFAAVEQRARSADSVGAIIDSLGTLGDDLELGLVALQRRVVEN